MDRETIKSKMQSYLQRIEDAKRRELERLQARSQCISQFQELAQTVMRTTMESFAQDMESQVCSFRIDGDYTNSDDPQIRFWITPMGISLNEYEFKDVPHLFYGVDPVAGSVVTHISTVIKGKAGRIYEGPSYKLEEVTPETVERDIVKVVNELMDNILA